MERELRGREGAVRDSLWILRSHLLYTLYFILYTDSSFQPFHTMDYGGGYLRKKSSWLKPPQPQTPFIFFHGFSIIIDKGDFQFIYFLQKPDL